MIVAHIIYVGIVAGVIMQIGAMTLYYLGFTTFNVPRYAAGLVTQKWGLIPFLLGTAVHLVVSVSFAFLYAWAYNYLGYTPSWQTGLVFGLVHDLVVGPLLPVLDMLNGCVPTGKVRPLSFFTTGYGYTGTATFLIGHLIYGAIVGYML